MYVPRQLFVFFFDAAVDGAVKHKPAIADEGVQPRYPTSRIGGLPTVCEAE